ncbi:MAG: 3'-5' exoribonuclease YhaM family protein [Candidatus Helarchaeota archaeon]
MGELINKQFVKEIKSRTGLSINTIFYLAHKEIKLTKKNEKYIRIKLSDRTGTIDGSIFNPKAKQVDFDLLYEGEFYKVIGNITDWGINIKHINKIDRELIDEKDFKCEITVDIEKLYSNILEKVNTISNEYLRKLLELFFKDEQFVDDFKFYPSATVHHHNYSGGNLEHTLGVILIAETIANFYDLDRDLLIAGAILHDIGKFQTYNYDNFSGTISENDLEKLFGHIFFTVKMIESKIDQIEGFPDDLKAKLIHMILSHHGKLEWGSPVIPKTPEACVLHYADLSDARVKELLQDIKIVESE